MVSDLSLCLLFLKESPNVTCEKKLEPTNNNHIVFFVVEIEKKTPPHPFRLDDLHICSLNGLYNHCIFFLKLLVIEIGEKHLTPFRVG